jgi:hypothetical protein
VKAFAKDGWAQVEVCTAIKDPTEERERIFERFYQRINPAQGATAGRGWGRRPADQIPGTAERSGRMASPARRAFHRSIAVVRPERANDRDAPQGGG